MATSRALAFAGPFALPRARAWLPKLRFFFFLRARVHSYLSSLTVSIAAAPDKRSKKGKDEKPSTAGKRGAGAVDGTTTGKAQRSAPSVRVGGHGSSATSDPLR